MPKSNPARAYGRRKYNKSKLLQNFKKSTGLCSSTTATTSLSLSQSEPLSLTEHMSESENMNVSEQPPVPLSASHRKLAGWTGDDTTISKLSTDKYISLKLSSLNSFVSKLLCPECASTGVTVKPSPKLKRGLYCKFVAVCEMCNHSMDLETESKSEPVSLDRLTVLACKETGITYEQLARFYGVTNHIPINRERFTSLAKTVHIDCRNAMKDHFAHLNKIVRTMYSECENRVIEEDDLLDTMVTFDGTWQKRGRTSHHGIGVVIDVKSGFVLDFEVLSNFCSMCEKNVAADDEWKRKHAESGKCQKNFDSTSGEMEAEAALRMWNRSISLHRMRYAVMVSDGDTKAFKAVSTSGVYDVKKVEKQECINHVSKRMYNRLCGLKKKFTGKERIHGHGRLTDDMMRKFQSYYRNAIAKYATNGGTIERLRDNILAILYHYMSSDSNPLHQYCPTGHDTWCKYNQLALGLIDDLPPKPVPTLPVSVGEKIKPVFEFLSGVEILQRCSMALTQNANESFNSTIWMRCPKIFWSSATSVYVGTALACLKFNKGAGGVFDVFQGMERSETQMAATRRSDAKRLYGCSSMAMAKKLKRRYSKKKNIKPDNAYCPGGY